MSRVTNYIFLMSGLLLLFYFTGLLGDETPASILMNLLLSPENLKNLSFYAKAVASLEGIALIGAVAFAAYRGNIRDIALAGFAVYLGSIFWEFLNVYLKVAEAINPQVAILIFAPLLMVWIATLVEWIK